MGIDLKQFIKHVPMNSMYSASLAAVALNTDYCIIIKNREGNTLGEILKIKTFIKDNQNGTLFSYGKRYSEKEIKKLMLESID